MIVKVDNYNLLRSGTSLIDNEVVIIRYWVDRHKMIWRCSTCEYKCVCKFQSSGYFHPLDYYLSAELFPRPGCLNELIINESLFIISLVRRIRLSEI